MRDHGDYDVFASFNIDALDESIAIEWVLQCHEFLEEEKVIFNLTNSFI